jgi:hypothetical protein
MLKPIFNEHAFDRRSAQRRKGEAPQCQSQYQYV